VVVETRLLPGELLVFGDDPAGVVRILDEIGSAWTCVEADEPLARRVGEMFYARGMRVRYVRGIYFELRGDIENVTRDVDIGSVTI